MLETAARFYYSSQAELLTFNFYPIVILAIITVVGKKSQCMVYNFYPFYPYISVLWPLINGMPRILGAMSSLYADSLPTGYGIGLSGFGSHSRNAFVPQIQDYQYGDFGYPRMVSRLNYLNCTFN